MNKDLRDQLKKHIDAEDISMTAASRAIGYSASAISSWMAGKYDGDVDAVEAAVVRFLKRKSDRLAEYEDPIPFIQTSAVTKIHEVARRAHLRRWMCCCYGDAGIGKTEAAKAYASEDPDVILVEASIGMTAKALFTELAQRVGLDGEGSTNEMFVEVVKKLKGSDRMIIIDEAENLAYRTLEYLRRTYDMSKIGVLLIGTRRLITNLRGKRGQYAQLYSRMRIAREIDVLNGMDVHDIVQKVFPNSNGVWKAFHEASKGNARVLSNLIENSRDVVKINKISISPDVVKETAKMLIV